MEDNQQVTRYSLTLRSVGKNFKNSTIILGDSNTEKLHFGETRGTFGSKMPGKRCPTYHIGDMDPTACIGYQNIVVHVGINDLRESSPGRKPDDPAADDTDAHFLRLTRNIELIQTYCPKSRIILAPLLPTKLWKLNERAIRVNSMLLSYVTSVNTRIRFMDFTSFVDQNSGLLRNDLGRFFRESDPLHLGKMGIRKLAEVVISAIFRPTADGRSYSSVTGPSFVSRGQT